MTHLEIYQFEKYVPKSEREWLLWAAAVEELLNHSLDGDQSIDGYSMDCAYDAFLSGANPMTYVRDVHNSPEYNKQ